MGSLFQATGNAEASKEDAKRRLKLLLIHDQIDLSPSEMEEMKSEIMGVIRRYLEVDEEDTHFHLDRQETTITLVGAVPITRVLKKNNKSVQVS